MGNQGWTKDISVSDGDISCRELYLENPKKSPWLEARISRAIEVGVGHSFIKGYNMTKEEAIKMIDKHKNSPAVIHPLELFSWTWLRVIILQIPDDDWDEYVLAAVEVMSK